MKIKYANIVKVGKAEKRMIRVQFPFDWDLLNFIKTFQGRSFDKDTKDWYIPLTLPNALALLKKEFQAGKQLSAFIQDRKVKQELKLAAPIPAFNNDGKLRPYQEIGFRFIQKRNGRALIADEMGLGKTIEAIAWAHAETEERPLLISVPASLKIKWEREVQKWMFGETTQILSSQTPYKISGSIVIINHDIIKYWQKELIAYGFKGIIIDEVHHFRNSSAQRTKALKKIGKVMPNVIGLSGTPFLNRPIELFNVINIIDASVLPNYIVYVTKFCNRHHNGFGWDVNGASNIPELYKLLTSTLMIRRLKKDVAKDLPDKTYSLVPLPLDNKKEYDAAEADFLNYMGIRVEKKIDAINREAKEAIAIQTKMDFEALGDVISDSTKKQMKQTQIAKVASAEMLVKLGVMRQLAVAGKMKGAIDWVSNFLESGEKLIVFVTHKFVSDQLMQAFPAAVKVDGSVTGEKRQAVVDAFQSNPKIKLLIGNHRAAGEGIDLTAASNVAILEYPDTAAAVDQDIDRVHRIGQNANKVTAWFLFSMDTIEEKLVKRIDDKRRVTTGTLDGSEMVETSTFINDLVNAYKN